MSERWRSNIGYIAASALIAQLVAGADDPVLTEPDAHLGEVKTELREAKAEILRLEKELEASEAENKYDSIRNNVDDEHHRNSRTNTGDNNIDSQTRSNVSLSVEATFYTAYCDTGCIGITATGLDVSNTIYTPEGHRVIAVDPAQIPLGSLVQVTLSEGSTFKAKAEDTGGDIKGARIDVLVATRDEAYRLGRQSATVEVLAEGGR